MKKKKKIGRKLLSFLLTLAMVVGLMPGMSLTAYAETWDGNPYSSLVKSTTTVKFNGMDWYIIADNSTALNAGTVTLFAKDKIATSQFNPQYYGNAYNGSTIKRYLDNLISSSFFEMSDAIVSVDLQDVGVTGAKLWLLSTSEVEKLDVKIKRCSSNWWLRTPGSSDSGKAFCVDGNNGGVVGSSGLPFVDLPLGVRPALKLDLSKVEFNNTTQTFSAIGQTVSVANMNLEPSTPQTIAVGEVVSFTASISPNEATDKTVKWKIGGTDAGALKLYTDAACETPLGTDATEVMTVYAKGISTGNAIVTCLSNSDSAKFASCEVTVNNLQTQIEKVLTTITATGIGQASYSTNDVANVLVNNSSFNEACGWNGTDMSIEVTAADGYTITRCVFYDDANHIATDSVSPFKAETHHLDTIPYVNGGPIYEGSRGIKKIDVIGYYTGNSVTITPGSNMTKTLDSGDALQNGLSGAMTAVVYTADDGYYFPTGYNVEDVNGISVTRDSYTQITVSGTPTADAAITLAEPTAKTKPDAPAVSAVNCTTAANNDGKLTGVTTAMEYKKSDATNWTVGTGNDITGLVPGTYYVRLRATDTTLVSDNQELVISAYTVPGQVVAPVFNPAAGTYTEAQSVTISCETTGADIYYTTNGSEPMTSSTKYEGSISVAETTTIKAIAIKDGMENSEVTSATYTISEAMPTKYAVTVNDGTGDGEYVENTTVAITANEAPSGKIFDSWTSDDGVTFADANATTTTFTMPAKAVTVTANYRNVDTVAMPTFSPVGGTYSSAQSVTISCSTTGADIYYTTNGNEPTTSSTKYTGAISISATTTVKAIAVKSGMTNSAVASAVYTIKTSPVITKAPEAITGLVYNGKAQALITAGEVTGGTLYYAVVKAGDAEPSAELYTTSIPTAINAGSYYVWYKAVGDSTHTDTEPVSITVTIANKPSAPNTPYTPYTPSTPSTPGTPATEAYTVPVSNENTVDISVNISEGNAVVQEITQADLDKITETTSDTGSDGDKKTDDTKISVDVSGAKSEVTSVELSGTSVETLAKTVEASEKVDSVEIKLTNATVELDSTALLAVSGQKEGNTVKLVVENKEQTKLNETQKESLKSFTSVKPFQAYFESGGKEIHDFKGGKATVSIKFSPEAGRDAKYYHVYYVPLSGLIERYVTRYLNGWFSYTTSHFSDYAIVYDETMENETGKEDVTPSPSPSTAPSASPSVVPSASPSPAPSASTEPSVAPSASAEPSAAPGTEPSQTPSDEKTGPVTSQEQAQAALDINAGLKVIHNGTSASVQWGRVDGAKYYKVYAAYCGSKWTLIKTVNAAAKCKVTIKKLNGKKLSTTKNIKVYVAAYRTVETKNGTTVTKKDVRIAKTIAGHVVGKKNKKYSNAKKIKLSKTSYTLKKGKKAKIKAKTVLQYPKRKQLGDAHAKEFRYASSDKSIATVSKSGKITAKKKGSCVIYVYARNGLAKKVKVTVK